MKTSLFATFKVLIITLCLFSLNFNPQQGLSAGQSAYATAIPATLTAGNTSFKVPPKAETNKRIPSMWRLNGVITAIELLVKGSVGVVDWVMDPSNTQIRYHKLPRPELDKIENPNAKRYCLEQAKIRQTTFSHIENSANDDIAYYGCYNSFGNGYAVYTVHMYRKVLEWGAITDQLYKNALSGDRDAINVLKVVADDIERQKRPTPLKPSVVVTQPKPTNPPAKPITTPKPTNPPAKPANPPKPVKPVLNKPETKPETQPKPETPPATQPTQPEKHIKTDNKELDEIFKDATPTDGGNKSYHLPNMTQAELVEKLGKIPGAKQQDTRVGGKSTTLPNGIKVDTYPARTSSDHKRPGWSITMPNKGKPTYKGDTAK